MVHFWDDNNQDAQNLAIDEVEDYLFDEVRNRQNIDLTMEQMDELIESTMRIARNRSGK